MANTLTSLIPQLYEALDVVSRELVGFIPAVTRNSSAERAAVGETITIPIAPPATTGDITPGTNAVDDGDQNIGNTTMTISKSKYSPVRWSGEEQKGVGNSGMLGNIVTDQFTQSMRALVNLVEADLASLASKASRAYGTAGTTPFGTAGDLSDAAFTRKILEDNGAPQTDLQMVLGTSAIANIRAKQSVLFKVNEAGTDALLRQGIIGLLEGFNLHTSAQVVTPAIGTGSGYLVNNGAGYAVGATAITLDTGTGTVLAGDVVTFAGDTNKYVVATALTATVVTLAAPGLRQTLADNVAMTVVAASAKNMAFSKSAIQLITRAPAMPEGGDQADDVIEITDPNSGLAFQVAVYRQYRRVKYEVGLAWGFELIKPAHVADLLG